MTKRFAGVLAAIVLLFGAFSSASASAIATYTGGGAFEFAALGNPFGISEGDPVSWSTSHDPAWITGDFVAIGTNYPLGARLQHSIGSLTFNEVDDFEFSTDGLPDVSVLGGLPVDFDFIVDFDFNQTSYRYEAFEGVFSIFEYSSPLAPQSLSFASDHQIYPGLMVSGSFTDLAAAPVPAAVWLLGTGLVGLAGLRRKYRRQ